MVQEEFRFQTGLDPHHFHKSPREGSRTFILYLPRAQNQKRAPPRVLLFGDSIQVKHKPYLPKVIQCHQCWGFHDPHRCTRKPKCCLCSSPDHTEKFHPEIPLQAPKCTNCLGSHRADSPACKARPISQNGSIKHLPKSQLKALREANQHASSPSQEAPAIPSAPASQTCSTGPKETPSSSECPEL